MTLALPRGDKTPIVWSIAGSDNAGMAGLQADLKTLTALGAHGCTIVTSVTAQNSTAVHGFESVSPQLLRAQIDALAEDMPPQAIKIGMLGDADGIRVLAETLPKIDAYVVCDPVMVATAGKVLLDNASVTAMRDLLLPHVDLLTPNCAEAEALTGITFHSDADVETAAAKLRAMGAKAVLIKGWKCGAGFVQDYFSDGAQNFWLTLPERGGEIPRGTGCTMASALAAAHAFGFDAADAAVIAKAYVHRRLRDTYKPGKGPPAALHSPWPPEAEDMPWLTRAAAEGRARHAFPDCGVEPLGFYPVVDSAAWLALLLPLGIRTAQLRVKNKTGPELENEIRHAIALAQKYNARLFINDYWQLAIKHGAYGVHLGQEDLDTADIAALQEAGLRLGISTHSYAEAARAHSLRPSYIALGPIFPTTLKSMKVAPQGVETLRIWRRLFTCPLVAIGGIKLEQAETLRAAGADSIAVVSDITQNADPEARTGAWLAQMNHGRPS